MKTALEKKNSLEEHIKQAQQNQYKSSDEEKEMLAFFSERRDELKEARKNKGIEDIWRSADKAYEPHTLEEAQGKKVFASNDELGWRSKQVVLGADDNWQENSIPVNPYIKIQTALGIIVDRNPTGVFSPGKSKYKSRTPLIKSLYEYSWQYAKSKQQLKLFVFNLAKYGFAVARTYPLKIEREVEDLKEYYPDGSKENVYEKSTQVYYDDIFRESLSPWQVWIDNAATPGNPMSANDCMWYKDFAWDKFEDFFGHLKNFKHVTPVELIPLEDESTSEKDKKKLSKGVRVWCYENLSRDTFYVEAEMGDKRIPLVIEPIPHNPRNKKISLWYTHWTLRNDKDIEGIGLYEAMRGDHKLHTKIRAMTMDQLVLSIYKEFFYEGTDSLSDNDGVMRIKPGAGRQVVNPQNVRWSDIPGPGKDAYEGLRYQEEKMEEATGVTKGLQGDVTGKTAFEVSQAREAALKRLKTPLENICDALETDAYLTIALIEEIYSISQVQNIASEADIGEYQQGEMREVPLNLSKDRDGNYVQTDEPTFIQLNADDLPWEGQIVIKPQSVIANSELLERQTTLEMVNLLVSMLAQPPQLVGKMAKQILKLYDKDPKEWLPDIFFQMEQPGGIPNIFAPIGQETSGAAPTAVPEGQMTETQPPAVANLSNSTPTLGNIQGQ